MFLLGFFQRASRDAPIGGARVERLVDLMWERRSHNADRIEAPGVQLFDLSLHTLVIHQSLTMATKSLRF